jgi:dTDP-4-dehydrorhamnose reductase
MSNFAPIKRILITGGTGLLGVALQRLAPSSLEVFSIYFPERDLAAPLPYPIHPADVTDSAQMRFVFEWARPDAVIHTASIGSVDFAEKNRKQAWAVNVEGTEVIADLCRTFQSRLIYISSNAVFDGRTPFYSEPDPVNPINYYGQLKVEAEKVVQTKGVSWAIVRPILMYGWPYPGERDNPVVWWVRSLTENRPIKVVDNVFSKPLPAWSCAEVVWAVTLQNRTGVYHVAGRDHVSLYHFALQTAEVFNLDSTLITPVPDSYFPEVAPRPRDTSFDTTKMETELGLKPVGVREGLVRMRTERQDSAFR